MRIPRGRSGWTLIELVIMIAVGSILLVSFSRAAQSQVEASIRIRDSFVALHLAKRQMAAMNNLAYASVVNGSTSDADFPNFTIATTQSVILTNAAANVKQVTIAVSTPAHGTLVQLITYRLDVLTYGNGT
jgi:type II secretory pathway pseudopilin PulG